MGEILVDLGILDAVDLCRILAERRGYQFVDLRERPVDLSLMDLVPEEVARRYSALPIAHQDDHVVVAMAQPENVFALDDLRVLTELPVFPVWRNRSRSRPRSAVATALRSPKCSPSRCPPPSKPRTARLRTQPSRMQRVFRRPLRPLRHPRPSRPHLSRRRPRCPRRTKRSSDS